MSQRLKDHYNKTVVPQLMQQFQYKNIHQVPKIVKITVNRGLGEAAQNAKALEATLAE
ncbi:50S ribosomal protein L5, partial [Thermosynechococcus sp.]